MARLISAAQVCRTTYETWDALSPEWQRIIGLPQKGFSMLIWGASGSGKTTFAMRLCKELTKLGRVYYNSIEQGEGHSIKKAFQLVGMEEVPTEKFALGDRHSFEEMLEVLSQPRNRIQFVVIDSLQYIKLTKDQYRQLIARFPRKNIIIISWEQAGGAPKGEHAQGIRYMVDIKCYVKKGVAVADSRFGATVPYTIFDAATRPQHPQEGDQEPKNAKQPDGQLSLLDQPAEVLVTDGEAVAQ